LSHTI